MNSSVALRLMSWNQVSTSSSLRIRPIDTAGIREGQSLIGHSQHFGDTRPIEVLVQDADLPSPKSQGHGDIGGSDGLAYSTLASHDGYLILDLAHQLARP